MFWMVAAGADCTVGGGGLCGCSELIQKHLIKSFDDCTQDAAVAACRSGSCAHDALSNFTVRPGCPGRPKQTSSHARAALGAQLSNLPFKFHHDIGPFDMSWGFPSADTIEIEFSLPSDYYIGLGLTADGVGDAIAGWVDAKGKVHVGDYWDEGSRQPITDEAKGCKNNVEAVSGTFNNGVTTVRFRRSLNTGDSGCDEPILKGPMEINYAWCDADHCFDYHNGCKAYADGCLDSPHSLDAANHISVDFSGKTGKMLSTDIIV